jgi:hypothetical protein
MQLDAMTLAQACSSQQFLGITVVFAIVASILFPRLFQKQKGDDSQDGLFTANKRYSWEPSYFSRVRWITNAQEIITKADEKVGSSPDAPFHVV